MLPSVAIKSLMWPSVENVCPPLVYAYVKKAKKIDEKGSEKQKKQD